MLRISKTFQEELKQSQSKTIDSETQPVRPMSELLSIKAKIEQEIEDQNKRTKDTIANMFLAGPVAWPDYPECEDIEDPYCDEEWVPLDQDSQFRADSSSGE